MKITSATLAEQRAYIEYHAYACLVCMLLSTITHYTLGFIGLLFLLIAIAKTPRHFRDLRTYLRQ